MRVAIKLIKGGWWYEGPWIHYTQAIDHFGMYRTIHKFLCKYIQG